MTLIAQDRAYLLRWARRSVEHAAKHRARLEMPEPEGEDLKARRGAFVTLREEGRLRGCVGNLEPRDPLYLEVSRAAFSASMRDPRFPPVEPEETASLLIEISVLTRPVGIDCTSEDVVLAQMIPHRHGVTLRAGSRIGTFLPKVWSTLGTREAFMTQLKRKAGWGPAEWPDDAKVEFYEAEDFAER